MTLLLLIFHRIPFLKCTSVFFFAVHASCAQRQPLDISLTSPTLDTPPVAHHTSCHEHKLSLSLTLYPHPLPLFPAPNCCLCAFPYTSTNFAYDYTKFASHYFMSGRLDRSCSCTWSVERRAHVAQHTNDACNIDKSMGGSS